MIELAQSFSGEDLSSPSPEPELPETWAASCVIPASENKEKGRDDRHVIERWIGGFREAIGTTRVAVFTEDLNPSGFSEGPENHRLVCMGAIGIPEQTRNHRLSKSHGIGQWVIRHGLILRRDECALLLTPSANIIADREFEELNCQLAVPINDRENIIGVALLGEPIARDSFDEQELRRIFCMMEEFGLFLKQVQRQKQLSRDNHLLTQILSTIHCGTMVITPDLRVLKANSVIRELLGIDSNQVLQFDDIPESITSQVRGAMDRLESSASFFLSLPTDPALRHLRVTLKRLSDDPDAESHLLMVMIEDFSDVEAAKQDAFETATSRLTNQLQLLSSQ